MQAPKVSTQKVGIVRQHCLPSMQYWRIYYITFSEALTAFRAALFQWSNDFWMRNLIFKLVWLVSDRYIEFACKWASLHQLC